MREHAVTPGDVFYSSNVSMPIVLIITCNILFWSHSVNVGAVEKVKGGKEVYEKGEGFLV